MREFLGGIGSLAGGFAYWRRRPGLMARGLIPAAIVAVLAIAGLASFGIALPGVTEAMTPFADGWPGLWAGVIRAAIGTALLGAALVILAVSFTALTLILGEPFYDRIWRSVERDLGEGVPDADYGLWRSIRDGLSLVARSAGIAAAAGLLGLIPVVGAVVGFVFGLLFTGWLLADELSSRALTARGLDAAARRTLLRANRARVLGFGLATQLCFFIPLGAIVTMPGAVAGSTALAHSLLARTALAGATPETRSDSAREDVH